jgi:hypothetical protein
MTRSDPCREAEWMLETIVDDFAQSLDLPDRARFYARLVELLTGRNDGLKQTLNGSDPSPDSLKKVH